MFPVLAFYVLELPLSFSLYEILLVGIVEVNLSPAYYYIGRAVVGVLGTMCTSNDLTLYGVS